jgi:preprotein translocase subunit YajC
MTTSGLYGTVVAVNDDETAILAIAPGVEVRWAMAALRDPASLPTAYRKPADPRVDMRKRTEPGTPPDRRTDGTADGTATA